MLRQSWELNVSNVDIRCFSQHFPYSCRIENAASCAMYVALRNSQTNAFYLALDHSVNGSLFINERNYSGDNFKSAQIGHTILVPNGRECSCGKKGCLNAYLSASALTGGISKTPEQFFELLERHDSNAEECWENYLEFLAIAISNLRMTFDCDIILGGAISQHISRYMQCLQDKVFRYNQLDYNISYLSICPPLENICASGAAKYMIDQYISNMDIPEKV